MLKRPSSFAQEGSIKDHVILSLLIAGLIMAATGACAYFLSRAYVLQQAEKNITNLLLSHKGIHHYVQQTLIPSYLKYQADGEIPATFYAPELLSSSYIVRNQHVFYNEERVKEGLPELYYKLAAINPRNPVNRADALEEKLIKMFNENREIKHFRDIIEVDGKKNLYVAIPFLENNEKCLRCHGKRAGAPPQLQERYPGESGFNEKVGEIRAITSIRSPLQTEYTHIAIGGSAILAGGLSLVFLFLFNYRLRDLVQRRTQSLQEEISVRAQAEKALRLTRISVDAASDALFWITPEARIVDVNQAACRSLGYSREELITLSVPDVDPNYDATIWQGHFPALRSQGTLVFESTHRAKDGRLTPVEIVANYVKVGDEEYNCAFVRDISERKRAEQERAGFEIKLRQSQKMEAIGTLAGGIAHDFNNILSAIFGYTDLALDEQNPETQAQYLTQIRKGAERATELVKQILTFSRRTEKERQPLQVSLIVKEALKMLRAAIPATIEIRQEVVAHGMVLSDPTEIHQIVMNLCTNAYHAMRETGGVIGVSLTEIIIQAEDEGYGELTPGRYLKLAVSDTGYGIPPEIREKIFEPYFTTKKTGEGTGLGLAVVHGIVKSYQGAITVYSEVGKETTFHVYLPLVEEAAAALPITTPQTDLAGHGERILFVDDEAPIRDFVSRLLLLNGYQVTVYTNGVQALEDFRLHPEQFDLMVTDMTMPHLSGAELAQTILGIRPDLPIIICTGQSELINREKALAMGIRDYLAKPVLKHDLLTALRRALTDPC